MNKERLIETFVELCKRDSESGNEREVADYILDYLKKIDLNPSEDNAGEKTGGNTGNIIIKIPGSLPGKILLSAHMDTVVPGKNVKPIVEIDRITSSGDTVLGADDKAGVAILLEIIKQIKEENIQTSEILVVFSVSEETGLLGAKNVDNITADYAYILDSSSKPGIIINEAPVHYTYEGKIKGKSSHAGIAPEKGINAIKIAGEVITKLPGGRIDFDTTANIGLISGGSATNIVPEEVIIKGEIRSYNKEKAEKLLNETKNIFITITEKNLGVPDFSFSKEYDNFKINEEEHVIQLAKKAIEKSGLVPKVESAGGGSDGNIYNQKGIPSVILGMGYENIHTKNEFMKKDDLFKVMEIVLNIVRG